MEIINAISAYWDIITFAGTVVIAAVLYWLSTRFVAKADCAKCQAGLDTAVDEIETRLTAIENVQASRTAVQEQLRLKLDALPTTDDIYKLGLSVKDVRGDIKAVDTRMDGLSHTISRLEKAVDMFTEATMRT